MANPTLPSNVPRPTPGPSNASTAGPSNNGTPRIKTEPGVEPTLPNFPPNYGNNEARERAIANLQQKFGPEANAQVNQINSQMLPNGQVRPPQNVNHPRPSLTPEQQRLQQEEYQRRQHAAAYEQMRRMAPTPSAANSRTDGSEEWTNYVAQKRQQAAETTRQADVNIRQHVEQQNRAMEGGGLMKPLSEQSDLPQLKRRKVDTGEDNGSSHASQPPPISQMDGEEADDDDADGRPPVKREEKDELFDDADDDAINSDLDDPDDNEIEEQDDGEPKQIMLCTYDKVQRVKNKWKCTLRDGVLNSGGKE